MDLQNQAARDFDRTRDKLVVCTPMRHGDGDLQPNSYLPIEDFTDDRLRQFIRIGRVAVEFGARAIVIETPSATTAPTATAPVPAGLFCDFPGCGRGPFKAAVNLGAHKRVHKTKE